MRTLLSIILLSCMCTASAQGNGFKEAVVFIQKKVACCSMPFKTSGGAKVDSIFIEESGGVTLYYSDKREKNSFNLFELYKESECETGIDTILKGKFIQFNIAENKVRLIRFATAADAKEVYEAFLKILRKNTRETRMIAQLDFNQTLNILNATIAQWAEFKDTVKVTAHENGNIIIANKRNQFFKFNLFELKAPEGGKWPGIKIRVCEPRAHAPSAWINFEKPQGNVAFIRLDCDIPPSELEMIKTAFLHLKTLSKDQNHPG